MILSRFTAWARRWVGAVQPVERLRPPAREVRLGPQAPAVYTVVVVDDQAGEQDRMLEALARAAAAHGGAWRVFCVATVAEGISRGGDADLVVVDGELNDPAGDGVTVVAALRRQPRAGRVILANSSSATQNNRMTSAGADGVVHKDPERLVAWLAEHGPARPAVRAMP